MAKLTKKNGITSQVLRVKIADSSKSDGSGVVGITNTETGLIISTMANNEATATAYTSAGSTIETITTLGTYETPTAGKCRFKEVDSTNHPGLYEIHLEDARFAVASATELLLTIPAVTASNISQTDLEIQLVGYLAEDVWTQVMESEGSITAQQVMSVGLSVLAGVTQSGGRVYLTPNGNATRVTPTVDSGNNRTAVTLNPSS